MRDRQGNRVRNRSAEQCIFNAFPYPMIWQRTLLTEGLLRPHAPFGGDDAFGVLETRMLQLQDFPNREKIVPPFPWCSCRCIRSFPVHCCRACRGISRRVRASYESWRWFRRRPRRQRTTGLRTQSRDRMAPRMGSQEIRPIFKSTAVPHLALAYSIAKGLPSNPEQAKPS